ncbi:MAG: hypothetical protein RLY43_790 [Bacteroidota bacterium]|jgi:hypothetical protein
MDTIENLIHSLELLSDKKSFSMGVHSTRSNLWLLHHFKHLTIKNNRIIYRINNGYRQRKSTINPVRTMRKNFDTTAQFLTYLATKSYELLYFELEFTNGWKIKERPQTEYYFYTNSTQERNDLIHKLFIISGQEPIIIGNLIENITYFYSADGTFYIVEDMPSPDEYWSEERKDKWKIKYNSKHYPEKIISNKEGIPFDSKTFSWDNNQNDESPF